MGKSGGGDPIPTSPLAAQQAAELAQFSADVAQPIQDVVTPQVLSTLAGPGVFQTSLSAPDREAIENQFKQAEGNIMATGQRGGHLMEQLTDLNSARAGAVSEATNNAEQLGIERALGLIPSAFPNASSNMSAMSSLANSQQSQLNNQAQADASANAAKGSDTGSMVSTGLSAAMMAWMMY